MLKSITQHSNKSGTNYHSCLVCVHYELNSMQLEAFIAASAVCGNIPVLCVLYTMTPHLMNLWRKIQPVCV